jgi:hypothetical protein
MAESLQALYRDLELCTRCGELRGAIDWTDGRAECHLEQECACQRALRSDALPRWWGFDFNVVAELCHVCETEVVPSGSRFSAPVCDDCRSRELPPGGDGRLDVWAHEALLRNLVDAGLANRSIVPLGDYLEVVQLVDREARIDECITFLDRDGAID